MTELKGSTVNKVAEVTILFWIMKICATVLGETAGDLMSMTLNIGYGFSSAILIGLFLIAVVAQLRSSRFHPILFWTVILTTLTAGTTLSDFMDRTLGLGYANGVLVLIACLSLVLALWRLTEGTLSVSNIRTRRAEVFYWVAILVSNTLGTALGDFLADDSGLGFLGGAVVIGGLIALVALAACTTALDRVILFWLAFILTRPFGATFGDFLTKPPALGGLDLGTVTSSMILASLLGVLSVYSGVVARRKPAVVRA